MKKSYTFKLGDGKHGSAIFFLTVLPSGDYTLVNAYNKKIPPEHLLGSDTAEFALMLSSAMLMTKDPVEREDALTKVVAHYHQGFKVVLWSENIDALIAARNAAEHIRRVK